MNKIGIIGGSGLYQIEGMKNVEPIDVYDTPFGQPTDHFKRGVLEGVEVIFLARHGVGHHISPSDINYRANIYEMKRLGVNAILSVSAVGSLREEIKPMDFVVPDQFVDRTNRNRQASFFDGGIVAHVPMADPVSSEITTILVEACKRSGATVHPKGTYINMEGPQFSTKAESKLYRSWGMDIIGMTNMVEAKLAREAEIAYASLCAVTDYDCWHPSHDSVTIEMILGYLAKNVDISKNILKAAIPQIAKVPHFAASNALQHAIVTQKDHISEGKKADLRIIIGKYIN